MQNASHIHKIIRHSVDYTCCCLYRINSWRVENQYKYLLQVLLSVYFEDLLNLSQDYNTKVWVIQAVQPVLADYCLNIQDCGLQIDQELNPWLWSCICKLQVQILNWSLDRNDHLSYPKQNTIYKLLISKPVIKILSY